MSAGHEEKTEQAIEAAEVPWSDALVLVCTRCARKLGDDELSETLKKDLKEHFRERLGKGHIRVVTSSCLDVCPKDRIALAVGRGKDGFESFTVEPGIAPEWVVEHILKRR